MGYQSQNITNAVSPEVGPSATTYTTEWDTTAQALDNHDHTSTKGKRLSTNSFEDAAITAAKLASSVAGAGITGGAGTALAVGVDNSTIEISSDTLQLKANGITKAKQFTRSIVDGSTATNGAIARTTLSSFSRTGSNAESSSLCSVTITTNGRPVLLFFGYKAASSDFFFQLNIAGGARYIGGQIILRRGSTLVAVDGYDQEAGGTNTTTRQPVHTMGPWIDVVAAGTYTYNVSAKCLDTDATVGLSADCYFFAMEMGM